MAVKNLGAKWFKLRGWKAFPFQKEVWKALSENKSGLLHATTGSGKTYAVWLGALACWSQVVSEQHTHKKMLQSKVPLTVLWITPMRALSADTYSALKTPLEELKLDWTIGIRTGDTSSYQKTKIINSPPSALVTTPESLSLLLTRSKSLNNFAHLKLIVVDEWHELIGNKRGVLLQLALARLRKISPNVLTWGMSATLANLDYAFDVLNPTSNQRCIIQAETRRKIVIDTLFPDKRTRLSYYGHLGLMMLPYVLQEIERYSCSLIFTNTRAQCEMWYQALLEKKPEWAGEIALHHSSLDADARQWVEAAVKSGKLRAVICTSSLDLGVDFSPVEKVFQIGSPKSLGRLLQRAGRSGHSPGKVSRITIVPTYHLEYLEAAAVQLAIKFNRVEPRLSLEKPYDVLVQHMVSTAMSNGFVSEIFFQEVKSTYAYKNLTFAEWNWCIDFLHRGGDSLTAYPEYQRIKLDENNYWQLANANFGKRHLANIGTIVSESQVSVRYWKRGGSKKTLGSIEESFAARLKPGDHFILGGNLLEFVKIYQMIAYVRKGHGKKSYVPRWNGGRLSLSSEVSDAMLNQLELATQAIYKGPEMRFLKALLEIQQYVSAIPSSDRLLIEIWQSREGSHAFLYPFAGRGVHSGLAHLIAFRLATASENTFAMSVNDYGFELLSFKTIDWSTNITHALFDCDNLVNDIVSSLNAGETAKRRFREIAQISGLIFSNYQGSYKTARQLQASSSLFFEVFSQFDPNNRLLKQAEIEVLNQELEISRLGDALKKIQTMSLNFKIIQHPTPFSFPLVFERFQETLSTEKLTDRVQRMLESIQNDYPDRYYQ